MFLFIGTVADVRKLNSAKIPSNCAVKVEVRLFYSWSKYWKDQADESRDMLNTLSNLLLHSSGTGAHHRDKALLDKIHKLMVKYGFKRTLPQDPSRSSPVRPQRFVIRGLREQQARPFSTKPAGPAATTVPQYPPKITYFQQQHPSHSAPSAHSHPVNTNTRSRTSAGRRPDLNRNDYDQHPAHSHIVRSEAEEGPDSAHVRSDNSVVSRSRNVAHDANAEPVRAVVATNQTAAFPRIDLSIFKGSGGGRHPPGGSDATGQNISTAVQLNKRNKHTQLAFNSSEKRSYDD